MAGYRNGAILISHQPTIHRSSQRPLCALGLCVLSFWILHTATVYVTERMATQDKGTHSKATKDHLSTPGVAPLGTVPSPTLDACEPDESTEYYDTSGVSSFRLACLQRRSRMPPGLVPSPDLFRRYTRAGRRAPIQGMDNQTSALKYRRSIRRVRTPREKVCYSVFASVGPPLTLLHGATLLKQRSAYPIVGVSNG